VVVVAVVGAVVPVVLAGGTAPLLGGSPLGLGPPVEDWTWASPAAKHVEPVTPRSNTQSARRSGLVIPEPLQTTSALAAVFGVSDVTVSALLGKETFV
jgi:hypothetical protein